MTIVKRWVLSTLAMLFVYSMAGLSFAQNVSVSPKRIVVENGEKYGEMLVFNSGDEAALIRVSLRNLKMTAAGSFVVSEGDEGYFADKIIRVAPRQMKIEPKTRQVLRVIATKPSDLPDGEYHSHIVVRVIPSLEKVQSLSTGTVEENKSAISLLAITELVFPAIVRKGADLDAEITIEGAKLITHDSGRTEIAVKLAREGNRSVLGDMKVFFQPDGQEEYKIGFVKGIAVYTELETRLVRIPIYEDMIKKMNLASGVSGHIRIDFVETHGNSERVGTSYTVPIALP